MFNLNDAKIGVLGLGYVGLPLAIEFGCHFPTIGFDISAARIKDLQAGHDNTKEVGQTDFRRARHLSYSTDISNLRHCNVFIVTVPTPIDRFKRPDLGPLLAATEIIAGILKPGDTVIYESTVFPGATEEVCVPLLESESKLRLNSEFFIGYSPERINPGDKKHRLPDIIKVTSGSTPAAAEFVDKLYSTIITAGTHPVSSIRVAEAAKVIENTQRDVNIALVNELARLFYRLNIDTQEVLDAAGTKWNFLPFRPGLVGGHCIGVDPYYLTHKAQDVGFLPEIILAGRRVNDSISAHVTSRVLHLLAKRKIHILGARVLIMGLSFKENCPDIRNSRVVDIVRNLQQYDTNIDIYDPWVDPAEARAEYEVTTIPEPEIGTYDAIIMTVAHDVFRELGANRIRQFAKPGGVFFDTKSVFSPAESDGRL